MRKTATYARQSLDKKDSLSIEAQLEECKKRTKEEVIEYFDKGYSGKNTERPDLKRLIIDIKQGKIKQVIVYKLDRISRNIVDFYKLYEIMKKHNCSFVSATENFNTEDVTGEMLMGFLAIFAQMERANIQQRVKDNYYYRAKEKGSWLGGPAPYGKILTKQNKTPILIDDEEEKKAVELMFGWYVGTEHCSLGEIARRLNDMGYKPRKRGVFNSVTVSKILQNPIYVVADELLYSYFKTREIQFVNEKEEWDGTTAAHVIGKKIGNANIRSYTTMKEQTIYLTNFPGYIPSLQYIKVQEQLAENKQVERLNVYGRLKELGGKIKCKECGYAIKSYSASTNGRPYLECYGKRSLHVCECKYNKINFYELQNVVGEEIQKQLNNLKSIYDKRKEKHSQITSLIEKKIQKLDTMIKQADENKLLEKAFQNSIMQLQKEIDELELEQQKASVSYVELSMLYNNAVMNFVKSGISYNELDDETKREIINVLIDKIYLTNDINDITIQWKI